MSCSSISKHIRRVHAAEIFRSAFSRSQGINSISVKDLDDLVVEYNVRPSLTVGAAEVLGSIAGQVCRITPSQISGFVSSVVDEAVKIQFNDSIRDLSATHESLEDIKDTLKFHRDFTTVMPATTEKMGTTPSRIHQVAVGAVSVALNVAETI